MKSPCIGTLTPNEVVTARFLVLSKEIRQKRTGEFHLALQLADRTGALEARMWDKVAEVMDTFDRDDFVQVKGLLQVQQHRALFTVHKLRRLEEHEVDLDDYFPSSERDPEEMWAELNAVIQGIGNVHIHALLKSVFEDPEIAKRYRIAPAAKNIHHASRGGLLEHVLSLCALCRSAASHYKNLDIDLLLAGAILHDIGKIEELEYARSFGYSADGQLLGHIVIGLRIVGAKLERLPGFPPKLRALIEHMIVSHHGELEFGSPKVPLFPEALLLHHLDNLDSKMDAMRVALTRAHPVDGEFTGWIPSLERTVLRKDEYLRDPEPPIRPAAAPHNGAEQKTATPPKTNGGKPAPMTVFGEKLQAVLGPEK
jgi:3'-5' exoribonuclease